MFSWRRSGWFALAFVAHKISQRPLDSTITRNDFLSLMFSCFHVFHDDEHATLAYAFEGLPSRYNDPRATFTRHALNAPMSNSFNEIRTNMTSPWLSQSHYPFITRGLFTSPPFHFRTSKCCSLRTCVFKACQQSLASLTVFPPSLLFLLCCLGITTSQILFSFPRL